VERGAGAQEVIGVVHKIQRALLATFALWAGAYALAMLLVPRAVVSRAVGLGATGALASMGQLGAGARLGLGLIALTAAFVPRPPRPLVAAIAIGLLAGVLGVVFNRVLGILTPADFKPFVRWLWIDGFFALALGATQIVRWRLRT
jgi:hypothetical protein